jgi:hypothetical protein
LKIGCFSKKIILERIKLRKKEWSKEKQFQLILNWRRKESIPILDFEKTIIKEQNKRIERKRVKALNRKLKRKIGEKQ